MWLAHEHAERSPVCVHRLLGNAPMGEPFQNPRPTARTQVRPHLGVAEQTVRVYKEILCAS
jgi:hypothetical protein